MKCGAKILYCRIRLRSVGSGGFPTARDAWMAPKREGPEWAQVRVLEELQNEPRVACIQSGSDDF
jgi:hypothetical protein